MSQYYILSILSNFPIFYMIQRYGSWLILRVKSNLSTLISSQSSQTDIWHRNSRFKDFLFNCIWLINNMRPFQKTHCFLRMVSIALWLTLPFGEKTIPISPLCLLFLTKVGKNWDTFSVSLKLGSDADTVCYWGANLSLMESSWTGFWFPDERNTHLSHCSLSSFSICACWDDAWTCCSHLAIMKWKKKNEGKTPSY